VPETWSEEHESQSQSVGVVAECGHARKRGAGLTSRGGTGPQAMPENLSVSRTTELPAGLEFLVQASVAEGFRFLHRLQAEWNSEVNRFNGPGEALFVAHHLGSLAGVCGLNEDPHSTHSTVGRLRHLYVGERFRRMGVGRALVVAALECGSQHFSAIRVRTDTRAADLFYRALGFSTVLCEDATHELQLPGRPVA